MSKWKNKIFTYVNIETFLPWTFVNLAPGEYNIVKQQHDLNDSQYISIWNRYFFKKVTCILLRIEKRLLEINSLN